MNCTVDGHCTEVIIPAIIETINKNVLTGGTVKVNKTVETVCVSEERVHSVCVNWM